jgi:GAF domain-containing protein
VVQLTSAADLAGLAEEMAALRRVATLLAQQPSPQEVVTAVTEVVGPLLGADLAAMLAFPGDRTATTIAAWSASSEMPPIGTRLPLDGDSVAARIYQTGAAARMDSYVDVEGQAAEVARALGLRSAVGTPILVGGRPWGALMAATSGEEPFPDDAEARIAAFTELVAAAISSAETRRELQRVATEQQALRRAATLVASGAPPMEVFATITTSVSELFNVPFASLLRYRPDQTATMVAGCGALSAYVGQTWTVPADDPGIVRTVVRSCRPARIEDHSGVHGPLGKAARALGVGTVVGVPVLVDGAPWGILAAGAAQDGPGLAADAGDRLVGLTELVTTTLINAETRDDLRRLADAQASLRRIATLVAEGATAEELFLAVAREVSAVLGAPVVTVDRYELEGGSPVSAVLASLEETQFFVGSRWPLDGPSARAWVYETRRPVRIEDFSGLDSTVARAARRLGMAWFVGAPIIVEGAVWGNICAGTTGDEPIPGDAESRLADFAKLLSTAIARSDARERVGRLLDEQAALRRVATLVAAGVDPDEVFAAVSDEVADLSASDGAAIGRFEPDGTGVVAVGLSDGLRGIGVGTRADLDDSLAFTEVYRTGRAARREQSGDDVVAPGVIADTLRGMRSYSTVATPIVVEGTLWGILMALSARVSLPPDTEERLEKFGELVATAIANAESRAELAAAEGRAHALAEEQAALRRVATLVAQGTSADALFALVSEEVGGLFDAEAAIARFEPDGPAMVVVGRTGGIPVLTTGTRWRLEDFLAVYRTGRPGGHDQKAFRDTRGAVADSLRAMKFASTVATPIVVEGEFWGVLAVSDAHRTLPPDTEERVGKFNELVALAIANAESRAELAASEARARELASEQAALRRVATLVARGASHDELFSAVAQEAADIVDIPAVGIQRYEADGTFVMLGIAGKTKLTVGSRWPVEDEGVAGMILATGQPARRDDYSQMPGPLGDALRDDLTVSTVGVPVVVDGRIWGFMVAAGKPGRPIPDGTEERLTRFTELVATAVSNATTRAELLASRARVVSAADETRRRLERDLHDGIQQWLVALALRARKAATSSASGDSAAEELAGLADDLVAVTEELRDISRGIHPAILSESGLDDALKALARRSAIRVDLDVTFQGRYDPTLESTVYYVAAESLTNAVKHAQASAIAVRGGLREGGLELEIHDDGVGGADPRRGTGILGLKDRVDALGGTISVSSPTGAGTTIRVTLPEAPRKDEDPLLRRIGLA